MMRGMPRREGPTKRIDRFRRELEAEGRSRPSQKNRPPNRHGSRALSRPSAVGEPVQHLQPSQSGGLNTISIRPGSPSMSEGWAIRSTSTHVIETPSTSRMNLTSGSSIPQPSGQVTKWERRSSGSEFTTALSFAQGRTDSCNRWVRSNRITSRCHDRDGDRVVVVRNGLIPATKGGQIVCTRIYPFDLERCRPVAKPISRYVWKLAPIRVG
jgi:hypothetical protein